MLKTSIFDTTWTIWIRNVPWEDAIQDVLCKRAIVISEYDDVIKTANTNLSLKKPRWIVKNVMYHSKNKKIKPTVERVHSEYKGCCAYCWCTTEIIKAKKGKSLPKHAATRDHIHPRSQGGPLDWSNIVLSCRKCNDKKKNKSLKESWLKLLITPIKNPKCWGIITFNEAQQKGLIV